MVEWVAMGSGMKGMSEQMGRMAGQMSGMAGMGMGGWDGGISKERTEKAKKTQDVDADRFLAPVRLDAAQARRSAQDQGGVRDQDRAEVTKLKEAEKNYPAVTQTQAGRRIEAASLKSRSDRFGPYQGDVGTGTRGARGAPDPSPAGAAPAPAAPDGDWRRRSAEVTPRGECQRSVQGASVRRPVPDRHELTLDALNRSPITSTRHSTSDPKVLATMAQQDAMEQAKEFLRQVIKYRFWISISVAALFATIAYSWGPGPSATRPPRRPRKSRPRRPKSRQYNSNTIPNARNTSRSSRRRPRS